MWGFSQKVRISPLVTGIPRNHVEIATQPPCNHDANSTQPPCNYHTQPTWNHHGTTIKRINYCWCDLETLINSIIQRVWRVEEPPDARYGKMHKSDCPVSRWAYLHLNLLHLTPSWFIWTTVEPRTNYYSDTEPFTLQRVRRVEEPPDALPQFLLQSDGTTRTYAYHHLNLLHLTPSLFISTTVEPRTNCYSDANNFH